MAWCLTLIYHSYQKKDLGFRNSSYLAARSLCTTPRLSSSAIPDAIWVEMYIRVPVLKAKYRLFWYPFMLHEEDRKFLPDTVVASWASFWACCGRCDWWRLWWGWGVVLILDAARWWQWSLVEPEKLEEVAELRELWYDTKWFSLGAQRKDARNVVTLKGTAGVGYRLQKGIAEK